MIWDWAFWPARITVGRSRHDMAVAQEMIGDELLPAIRAFEAAARRFMEEMESTIMPVLLPFVEVPTP